MYFAEPASRRLKALEHNRTLEKIFDYLTETDQIDKMMAVTAFGRPALEGVIEDIERLFPFNEEFNLLLNYNNRQLLGSVTRYIMGHYGYMPGKPKKMKKGHYVGSAIVYRRQL